MIGIVPLAGPEVFHPDSGIRPLIPIDGEPLLRRVLTSRAWWRRGELHAKDLIFVLREGSGVATLSEHIQEWFPDSRQVRLSGLTSGALLSCLAGTSLVESLEQPLCVDLADILYDTDESPTDMLHRDGSVGAVVPCFESTEPCYSYLEMNEHGEVVRTAERQVISNTASAGTYVFRNLPAFLDAAAYALRHGDELAVNGVHFVCPALNGVISQGAKVVPLRVDNVLSVSKQFHLGVAELS